MSFLKMFAKIQDPFTIYARALRLAWEAEPRYTTFSILASLLMSATVPAQVWITKLIIDQMPVLVGQDHPARLAGAAAAIAPILPLLGILLALWIAGAFCMTANQSIQMLFGDILWRRGQYLLMKKAAQLSVAFYDTPAYHDQMALARDQIYRLNNMAYYMLNLFADMVSLVTMLLLLGQVSSLIPLVLLVTTLPRLWVLTYYTKRVAALTMQYVPTRRMTDDIGALLTTRDMVKEIRLFQLQDYLLDVFLRFSAMFIEEHTTIAVRRERSNFLVSLLSMTGIVSTWVFAIYLALIGQASLGSVVLVLQSSQHARNTLEGMTLTLGYGMESVTYLKNYFAFLDLPLNAAPGALAPLPAGSGCLDAGQALSRGRIEFQDVTFRYPGAEKPVLEHLSFTIQPGHTLALVGENGAGKTTLVKLLTRLYDPSEGQILLDGCDLRSYPPEAYYRHIGVIFQDFNKYSFTARENIGVGSVESINNLERVRQAAAMGGALQMVENLPGGFETVLGRLFDNGVDLSGGEWQKIALSRAFMRDAGLLILDEPTAALDVFSESEVYKHFADLTRGKTTVFVTHRLSSVKIAQKILVLKEGRLIEEGSHDELMAQGGEYAQMFMLQAERYQ